MANYVECPFCERLFEDEGYNISRNGPSFEEAGRIALQLHIENDHHKVRVRKGSNYRWVDEKEIKRRLEQTERALAKGRR